ncbi:hypothetical protein KCMC57_up00450 [Kitasatospora sp. CMC57]|uniref:hypothetical protein n=1 Tax=Kitasatospora sp. CMC57 TaxID=3231513 RepID=UPI0038B4B08C
MIPAEYGFASDFARAMTGSKAGVAAGPVDTAGDPGAGGWVARVEETAGADPVALEQAAIPARATAATMVSR